MTKKTTIALDCMGGDKAPDIVLKGASLAIEESNDLYFLLFGDASKINPIVEKHHLLKSRSKIIHTEDFIAADEKPSVALRKGSNSSMRLAINSVKEGVADAIVSAGNTGALMAISKIVLRPLSSVDRPAIVTSLPNQKRKSTVFLDMGANIECDANVLYQFAVMGHAFSKITLGIKNPTIGVLNVGSEDLKGSEAVRGVSSLLKASSLAEHFYGYVEGDDIVKGTVDVVVTDGFSGNIALKAIEGTSKMASSLTREVFSSSILAKIGYLLASSSMNKVKKIIDPRMHNGAMLVGLNGIVIKSHGGTDHIGFANAIKVAASLVKNNVNEKIIAEINKSDHLNAA